MCPTLCELFKKRGTERGETEGQVWMQSSLLSQDFILKTCKGRPKGKKEHLDSAGQTALSMLLLHFSRPSFFKA